jgi:hypothetical protein
MSATCLHRGRWLSQLANPSWLCAVNGRQAGHTYLQHRCTAPPPHGSSQARDPDQRQPGRAVLFCRICRRPFPSWLLAWTCLVAAIGLSWREVVGSSMRAGLELGVAVIARGTRRGPHTSHTSGKRTPSHVRHILFIVARLPTSTYFRVCFARVKEKRRRSCIHNQVPSGVPIKQSNNIQVAII